MSPLASLLAFAFGLFAISRPQKAAAVWGRNDRPVVWYRIFGGLLCLAGILYSLDTFAFPVIRHALQ